MTKIDDLVFNHEKDDYDKYKQRTGGKDIGKTITSYIYTGAVIGFVAGAAMGAYVTDETTSGLAPDAPTAMRYIIDGLVGIVTGRYLSGPLGAREGMKLGIAKVKKVLRREE